MKKFATQLDDDVLHQLRAFAKEQGRNISSVVNEAVEEFLSKRKVRPAFRDAMKSVLDENEELLERLAK